MDNKGTTSFSDSKITVGDLVVNDGGKTYKFEPQKDMTGYEAALIAQMLATATMAWRHMVVHDYMEFLKKHNLTRHFKEKP
jgi:hypothetical protein